MSPLRFSGTTAKSTDASPEVEASRKRSIVPPLEASVAASGPPSTSVEKFSAADQPTGMALERSKSSAKASSVQVRSVPASINCPASGWTLASVPASFVGEVSPANEPQATPTATALAEARIKTASLNRELKLTGYHAGPCLCRSTRPPVAPARARRSRKGDGFVAPLASGYPRRPRGMREPTTNGNGAFLGLARPGPRQGVVA